MLGDGCKCHAQRDDDVVLLWQRTRHSGARDTCHYLPVQEFRLCAVLNPQYVKLLTTVLHFLRLLVHAASEGFSLWPDTVRKFTIMFLTTSTSAGQTM